jgi:hypothetical protein
MPWAGTKERTFSEQPPPRFLLLVDLAHPTRPDLGILLLILIRSLSSPPDFGFHRVGIAADDDESRREVLLAVCGQKRCSCVPASVASVRCVARCARLVFRSKANDLWSAGAGTNY